MKINRKQLIKSIAIILVFLSTLTLLGFNYKKASADINIIDQTNTIRSAPSKVNLGETFNVDYTVKFNTQSIDTIDDTRHNKQQWLACIYDNSSNMNYQMENDIIGNGGVSRINVQGTINFKRNKNNIKLDKRYYFSNDSSSDNLSSKMTEALNDIAVKNSQGHERDIVIMIGTNISESELQKAINIAASINQNKDDYKYGINTVVINIGNKSGEENIKKIADALAGNYIYINSQQQANEMFPADNLPYVSDLTANKYSNEGSVKKIDFNDQFSDNFQVVSAPSFITTDNTNKRINSSFNAYYYIQGNQIIYYPVSFTVNYKAIQYKQSPNSYIGDGAFEVSGNTTGDKKTLDKIYIDIGIANEVKMEITDSSGTINKKYDSAINGLDYNVDNNGAVYKLYGKSNVAIDVENSQATHLKYRFVKDGQEPSDTDWEYMALSGDVDTANPGYLTQMPYDVSHMPLLNNRTMWSNRNEVYKTPFAGETGLISTNVFLNYTNDKDIKTNPQKQYVTQEQVRDKDGNIITRWVPKTLFVNDQYVEGYASGYKEARKVWGYIKVNQTGNYSFKAYSDDGFYGTINVNGELKVLGDAFVPRSVGDSGLNATNQIALVKDVYYPIYLEYFNWGGSAAFRIECSLNNQSYQTIGSASSYCALYPSKSDYPIDNGNNIFMGATTVNFKTEPGIYTIQYQLLQSTGTTSNQTFNKISEGSFGKFEVEERFDGLSKSFSKNPIQKGESFNINYSLTPKPIKLTDLYKGNDSSNKPSSLYVKNLILTDELPEGLVISDGTNSTSINKVADIEYKYNSQTGQYEASPYTFSVNVKPKDSNVNSVSFSNSGQIDYRDISLKDDSRISQTQYFSDIPTLNILLGNSLITKHGLFNGSTIIYNSDPVNVVGSMNYTLGFEVDARGNNNNFTLNVEPNNADIDNICIYKLDSNENIIENTRKTISKENIQNTGNGTGSFIEAGCKYAVVYSINSIKGNVTLIAKLDSGDERKLNLNLQDKKDLF